MRATFVCVAFGFDHKIAVFVGLEQSAGLSTGAHREQGQSIVLFNGLYQGFECRWQPHLVRLFRRYSHPGCDVAGGV